jgi:predicted transcriptional regulator
MKTSKLLQTVGVITANPHDSLSTVLAKLPSSHSAAFIFDDEKKYIGVINPYYAVIRTSHPANAKVEHCLFHAPRIKMQFTSGKIAELMMESKIHYLPVFDDQEKFIGMVSARGLLRTFESNPVFTTPLHEMMKAKRRQLVTVKEDDDIGKALHIFKETKLSKLVVINEFGKLKGVLTYYDLISFLIAPKKKERGSFAPDKATLLTKKVKNFQKSFILSLNPEDYARDALHLILEKNIGSIVIVDHENRPVDILTTKDMMKLLIQEPSIAKVDLTMKNLSLKSTIVTKNFFDMLRERLRYKKDISKAKLLVKEEKEGGLFKVVLSLFPRKGHAKVVSREGKDLQDVFQNVKKEE